MKQPTKPFGPCLRVSPRLNYSLQPCARSSTGERGQAFCPTPKAKPKPPVNYSGLERPTRNERALLAPLLYLQHTGRRPAPATAATVLRNPPYRKNTQDTPAETPCPCCPWGE